EGAYLRRALSDRRGFSRRARRDAASERDCAWLRPAGHAGDRGAAHRGCLVGAAAGGLKEPPILLAERPWRGAFGLTLVGGPGTNPRRARNQSLTRLVRNASPKC